ncbi:MAG: ATP-dependent 6-phosphofructokinase [Spirochaetales bacterium]|nr:ATP-dependent 6-phosphofructokinase [Spirochaetales bacterium]
MKSTKGMKIGILTAGGDCPGLNAAIRGVGKTAALKYGMEVYGFSSGYLGLVNNEYKKLSVRDMSGILTVGGTILGTSREKPFKKKEYNQYVRSKPEQIKENYEKLGLDCVVCIGGNGTMKTAHKLQQHGVNVVGVPKTIDNDIWGTDQTFGFYSAVNIATDAIDRIHTTANSHKRVMVIEVMGHDTGWLTLYSGVAGGGDVILIPEIPYDKDIIMDYLVHRNEEGKPYSIVVVAEGIKVPPKKNGQPRNKSAGTYIAELIQKETGLDTRPTILGYIQRGGSPCPGDRILASELGAYTAQMISERRFGEMAALKNGVVTSIPLEEVAGKLKVVTPDLPLIKQAISLDTCFGAKI